VARRHAPTAELPQHLEALYRRFPFDRSLDADPLGLVRRYADDRLAAETAALFAGILAIGNTTAIRGSFRALEARVGADWGRLRREADGAWSARALDGFRHRWIRGDQLLHLARQLRRIDAAGSTLEGIFAEGLGPERADFAGGVDALARALRGPEGRGAPPAPRGYRALFPTPLEGGRSPCKRLVLFVRWMVRREPPDLGIWRSIDPSVLRIPLDQHVYWIAYHLGLTARRSRSWAAVEEVTEALRRVDPIDPVRFDFVLCHTGISGDCPKRRDLAVCGPCAVRPDCLLWRGRSGRAA
jgi:uncharacterized protein (TIGR02757 family)